MIFLGIISVLNFPKIYIKIIYLFNKAHFLSKLYKTNAILSAGGDIMIVMKVLAYKSQSSSEEILIYDHPT